MPATIVCLGTNVGDRHAIMQAAIEHLKQVPNTCLVAESTYSTTQPIGGPANQDAFLNSAVLLQTDLPPLLLLQHLQQIEQQLGRKRLVHWGPRTIDLDIALYGDFESSTPILTLPHPRLAFRPFMLFPAAQVAPQMQHPALGQTLAQLHTHLLQAPPQINLTGSNLELCQDLARQIHEPTVICQVVSPEAILPALPPLPAVTIWLEHQTPHSPIHAAKTLYQAQQMARQGRLGIFYLLVRPSIEELLGEVQAAFQAIASIGDGASEPT